ncbi:MAG: Zn-dependent exopeptidase M28 [bacterium]|nr:Zn-dependent exopeptidase M28 [bacterium]MCP5069065.1 Zn-dependent exopeptidase M28 [bacterium]
MLVSAHLDSAYEFNLWFLFRSAAVPIMVIGMGAPAVSLVAGALRAGSGGGFETLGWVCLALYPVVGLHLFFHTFSVVPGAMDDLAGISVLDGVARALSDAPGEDGMLRHTEVVLLATSAEEAGLRGAKRYVAAHRAELHAIPTYGLFVDGVYDERHLTVIQRELTTGARHDPRLVALAQHAAEGRNRHMHRGLIPFGGSDAAPFALAGVPSVTLLCHDISHLVPNYHTRHDTLEKVRPESIETMLQLVLDLLDRIDDGQIDPA